MYGGFRRTQTYVRSGAGTERVKFNMRLFDPQFEFCVDTREPPPSVRNRCTSVMLAADLRSGTENLRVDISLT